MEFSFTEEQLAWQQTARTFAYDELRPAALEADLRPDPSDCFMPEMVERSSQLGLRTLAIPPEDGGGGADILTQVIVLEELCVGDVGFGMTIQHAWREGGWLARSVPEELRERLLPEFMQDPRFLTSLAMTEEHFGSDAKASSPDPRDGPRTTAVRDGDTWVINGRKRWITNANVARVAFVLARTDPSVPWREGMSMFLVPTDTPGYRTERIEDKLGIRTNQNAEVVFEDCRVPLANLVGEVNRGVALRSRIGAGGSVKEGVKALGVARAAYEDALAWTRERVQGGKRLIEHGSIAATIAEMGMRIEMCRSLCWRAAWSVDESLPQAGLYEAMAMRSAKEVATEVTTAAVELHGAYGVQRERGVEKYARDAISLLHTGEGGHAQKASIGWQLAGEV